MTKLSSENTAVAESSQTGQLQEPLQMKTVARLILTAFGVFLCVALAGCGANKGQIGGQVVKIRLPQNTIAVDVGTTFVLEAIPGPTGQTSGWQYQWQQIIDETTNRELITTNIPDATKDQLILTNVQPKDADLYRCLIYKSGIRGETNYTSVFSLQVSGVPINVRQYTNGHVPYDLVMSEGTAVAGSFQPGNGSGDDTSCCGTYQDGMVFKNPTTGNWWLPPADSVSHSASITDQTTGVDYSTTSVYMRVLDETFTTVQCMKLPGFFKFYSSPTNAYMICLIFPGRILPHTGQQFNFTINWFTN
jgi:hypothetical protein